MEEKYLRKNYEQKYRQLEKDEEILKNTQRKGERLIEETISHLYHKAQQSTVENEIFDYAKWQIMQAENDFYDKLSKKRRQLFQQQEELERNYRDNLKKKNND